MKFPDFAYVRPTTLEEAVGCLAADDDARILAGGQSLLPLMALRLAHPSVLVDITGLDLGAVEVEESGEGWVLRIGALVRHSCLLADHDVSVAAPLLAAAAVHVGHPAIRNLGTLAGSLAHADPAAELPAAAVALGASVIVRGPGGIRRVGCSDLIEGFYSNSLEVGEVVTAVEIPAAGPRHGAAFCEWAARAGDFAEVGVGVAVETAEDGTCTVVRAAACGIGGRPVPLGDVLSPLAVGARRAEPALLREACVLARKSAIDAEASDDQADLAGLLTARSLYRAWSSSR